ncbi:TPA: hypothetical protein DDW35_00880 [Candidatus Sumerlaeota bacterium]|jgi:protein O-mannosyl-transferase|nr:hypothetical protein [Candidatus Sumerlaeota bacterium]
MPTFFSNNTKQEGTHSFAQCSASTPWGAILLLLALILAVYYPVFFAGFVWDDADIFESPQIHNMSGLIDIWIHPGNSILQDYMPLNYTTTWLEYRLWGTNPFGYHAVNLFLHCVNALLLLYLLRCIRAPGALFATLLFALHPVQISSVAWVAQRKDLLYVLFYFLTFLAWIRFEEKKTWARYLLVFALFAAGMLSKRMAITWPLAALVFSWWRSGEPQLRNALRLLPLLLFAVPLSFIVNLTNPTSSDAELSAIEHLSLLQKLLLACNNAGYYLGKLLWPREHVPFYPTWKIDPTYPVLYLAPVAIAATLIALWVLHNRIGRGPLAAAAFYLIGLSTILGFFPWSLMSMTYVQDHYQYLACIGPFLLLAYAMDRYAPRLFQKSANLRFLVYGTLAPLLLLPLATVAHKQVRLYHDRETLFRPNFEKHPDSYYGAVQFARGLSINHKNTEALVVLDQTIARNPKLFPAWYHKGIVHSMLGQRKEALAAFQKALGLEPNSSETMNCIAAQLLSEQPPNAKSALPLLEQALALDPDNLRVEMNLGTALYLTDRKIESRKHFERVIQTDPFAITPEALAQYRNLLQGK